MIASSGVVNMGVPGIASSVGDFTSARPAVESLLNYDDQGTGKSVPWLATEWKISPDYSSVTFTLRKGVKFHDGTDFNAEAVKYNLDISRLGVRAELKPVSSIDVIDPYTIRLNLSTYEPAMITSLAGSAGIIVSPTALKTMGDACATHPVGTGPFKFVSYQRDVSLKFERFEGYWQEGKPYLDGIETVFIADSLTALASFKAGEAHSIGMSVAKDAYDIMKAGKYDIIPLPSNIPCLIGDSAHLSSPFADIRVRRAIAYAIDKEMISNALGWGFFPNTNQIAPPGVWYYNPAVVGYPFNPQKAKNLLSEAGYPNGFQTKIVFSSGAANTDLFTAVQSYLSLIGIKMTLDAADRARSLQIQTGGWNNHLLGYSMPCSLGMEPGQALIGNFSSIANRITPESFYNPPDYDAKLSLAIAERDPEKSKTMFQELNRLIIDEYCMAIPLFVNSQFVVNSFNVHDLDKGKYNASQWRPEKAWLSK
jgi:peptide/nickel transport system substrate-binding protein